MSVFALSLNHRTAPVDLRGRFAFTLEQIPAALHGLRAGLQRITPEAALLSTCNRTELYIAADPAHGRHLVAPVLDWLASHGGVSPDDLRRHTHVLERHEAARHAFRVASGLDSMVLGEAQILGQMKQAVREADAAGTLGTTLHQLFQRSFSVAKEVRTSTEIGAHSISMAAAAVRLAGQLFEDLSRIRILFVGAGEMIELAATHFAAKAPRHMTIANRTLERGERLAAQFGAEVMRLADLPARLHEFDAVISCTASALPLIGLGAVERALKARRRRPIFMVDLAVPRDIEPEVAQLDDVFLYSLDDLGAIVESGLESREKAVIEAEEIIASRVDGFLHWLEAREAVPTIRALRDTAERMRRHEVEHALKLLARGEDPQRVLEALSHGLTNKLMHGPTAALNQSEGVSRAELAELIARIYHLHPGE